MNKLEEIENQMARWKATEKKHHGDGNAYLAGICQGNIDAFNVSLRIFSKVCTCDETIYQAEYVCPRCGGRAPDDV